MTYHWSEVAFRALVLAERLVAAAEAKWLGKWPKPQETQPVARAGAKAVPRDTDEPAEAPLGGDI